MRSARYSTWSTPISNSSGAPASTYSSRRSTQADIAVVAERAPEHQVRLLARDELRRHVRVGHHEVLGDDPRRARLLQARVSGQFDAADTREARLVPHARGLDAAPQFRRFRQLDAVALHEHRRPAVREDHGLDVEAAVGLGAAARPRAPAGLAFDKGLMDAVLTPARAAGAGVTLRWAIPSSSRAMAVSVDSRASARSRRVMIRSTLARGRAYSTGRGPGTAAAVREPASQDSPIGDRGSGPRDSGRRW